MNGDEGEQVAKKEKQTEKMPLTEEEASEAIEQANSRLVEHIWAEKYVSRALAAIIVGIGVFIVVASIAGLDYSDEIEYGLVLVVVLCLLARWTISLWTASAVQSATLALLDFLDTPDGRSDAAEERIRDAEDRISELAENADVLKELVLSADRRLSALEESFQGAVEYVDSMNGDIREIQQKLDSYQQKQAQNAGVVPKSLDDAWSKKDLAQGTADHRKAAAELKERVAEEAAQGSKGNQRKSEAPRKPGGSTT